MTRKLLEFFEDQYFDKEEFQKDLPTYFNDDFISDAIDEAVKKGTRRADWSEDGFERQKENWKRVLDDHKRPELEDVVIKNLRKNAGELIKLDFDYDGQERINKRIRDIAKTEPDKITSDYFDVIGVTRLSIKTVGRALDLSKEDTISILEKRGFIITDKGRIKK